jgi:4-hydroxy-3-methylbut-2-enyl diphosphate reductase
VSVAHDVSTLKSGDRVVLGFHGLAPDIKDGLVARGVDLRQDMFCPFIAKLDGVVERLAHEGHHIAMVGQASSHHCIVANEIARKHGRRCHIIEREEDLDAIADQAGWVLVGQVTGNTMVFQAVSERIRGDKLPIKIFRTMCGDSHDRQNNAAELAKAADVVIVVDDQGAAAQSVYEVCARYNQRLHKASAKDDVQPGWLEGAKKVAIVGGILVPEWTIEDIAQRVRELAA